MELKYKGSFFRDLDNISNRNVIESVKEKIDEIESVNNICTPPFVVGALPKSQTSIKKAKKNID